MDHLPRDDVSFTEAIDLFIPKIAFNSHKERESFDKRRLQRREGKKKKTEETKLNSSNMLGIPALDDSVKSRCIREHVIIVEKHSKLPGLVNYIIYSGLQFLALVKRTRK